MIKSICFVASTLPASFIRLKAESLGIEKVIVMSKPLFQSYMALKHTHPTVKIVLVPSGLLFGNLYLFFMLLFLRVNNKKIVFFHECCCPIFDIFIKIIRPNGMFFPQVTMSGFEEVSYNFFPKGKFKSFLGILNIDNLFKYYRGSAVGSEVPEFAVSTKGYPDSIQTYGQVYTRNLISSIVESNQYKREIIFLVGKSMVDDDYQIGVYKELICIALAHKFKCYIKNHPNPIYRLNIDTNNVVFMDPLVPVELLYDSFSLVVGTSSSGLLNFGSRAVSLIDLMHEMTAEDVIYLKNHFYSTDPLNSINFIQDVKSFETIISGIQD